MHQWFAYLWQQRQDENQVVYCFECGKPMHANTYKDLSTCYSHILGKKLYPKYAGAEWNVKICHPDCHNLYTIRPKQATNQYNEYLKLKQNLNL